jgi:hypothetical protein
MFYSQSNMDSDNSDASAESGSGIPSPHCFHTAAAIVTDYVRTGIPVVDKVIRPSEDVRGY